MCNQIIVSQVIKSSVSQYLVSQDLCPMFTIYWLTLREVNETQHECEHFKRAIYSEITAKQVIVIFKCSSWLKWMQLMTADHTKIYNNHVLNGIQTKVQWEQAWITHMLNISFLIADEWVNGVFDSTLLKWFEERLSTDPKLVCKWPTVTTVC